MRGKLRVTGVWGQATRKVGPDEARVALAEASATAKGNERARERCTAPLTNNPFKAHLPCMIDVQVIDDPAAASVALDPVRSRLLAELRAPASAAMLAERMALPRQRVNYHLRTLEAHGLVVPAGERRWGGIRERHMVAAASQWMVSPGALGPAGVDPEGSLDRLSASYLLALAGRAVRELGALVRGATKARARLATLSVDTVVRFRSPRDRAAFTRELTEAVNALVARYHDASAPEGRSHRVVLLAHPLPSPIDPTHPPPDKEESHAREEG